MNELQSKKNASTRASAEALSFRRNHVRFWGRKSRLEITKGGFVVGASGGRGVLNCAGKRYELEVSGLNAGLVIGMSRVSLRGTARNLQRVSDIEGTYSGVGASAAAGGGASNIVARNANGVQLTMRGTQAGLEASLNLGGTRIRLKR